MGNFIATPFLNAIRKLYANPLGESILFRLIRGKPPRHWLSRFVPMAYLFPRPSWRKAFRFDLNLELDISDIVDWHIYFGFHDPSHEALLREIKPTDYVLDIGANIGYVSLRCAQQARNGKVFGFEPSRASFSKCLRNLKLNSYTNVGVYNLGMGQQVDRMLIKVSDTHNLGMNRIVIHEDKNCSALEEVSISTVDHWMEENGVDKLDLIKIDVEGFEMEILKGAERTIKAYKPVLFLEADDILLSRFNSSSSALFDWLLDRGYSIYDLKGKAITNSELVGIHADIIARPD